MPQHNTSCLHPARHCSSYIQRSEKKGRCQLYTWNAALMFPYFSWLAVQGSQKTGKSEVEAGWSASKNNSSHLSQKSPFVLAIYKNKRQQFVNSVWTKNFTTQKPTHVNTCAMVQKQTLKFLDGISPWTKSYHIGAIAATTDRRL